MKAKPGFEANTFSEMNKQRLEIASNQDSIIFFSKILERLGSWKKIWPLLEPKNRSDSLCSILSITDSMLVFGQIKMDSVFNTVTLSQFIKDNTSLLVA